MGSTYCRIHCQNRRVHQRRRSRARRKGNRPRYAVSKTDLNRSRRTALCVSPRRTELQCIRPAVSVLSEFLPYLKERGPGQFNELDTEILEELIQFGSSVEVAVCREIKYTIDVMTACPS
jgi:hypothetical protein